MSQDEEKAWIKAKIWLNPDKTCSSTLGLHGAFHDMVVLSFMLVDSISGELKISPETLLQFYGELAKALRGFKGPTKMTVDIKALLKQMEAEE